MLLHAMLRSIHLLAMLVWLGGMFHTLVCLRPALAVLEPPPLRLRLMGAVLRRFFVAVSWAAGLMLASGVAMMVSMTGPAPEIVAMAALGLVMIAIFVFVRVAPFRRLQRALADGDAPVAAAALNTIRIAVWSNLAIGVAIVVLMQLAPALR
ncbi:MAG TPA: hypothetical protein VIO33_13775 [Burkholderiaceae bacterium]